MRRKIGVTPELIKQSDYKCGEIPRNVQRMLLHTDGTLSFVILAILEGRPYRRPSHALYSGQKINLSVICMFRWEPSAAPYCPITLV
jgi:hypothetical protein